MNALTPEAAGLTRWTAWDATREGSATGRLEKIRALAPTLKAEFKRAGAVAAVRTLPVARAPYPVTFAFNRACTLPYPFLLFQNRAMLVQFRQNGALKNLLFNPTLPNASATAPFFAHFAARTPMPRSWQDALVVKPSPPLPEQLRALGVQPEDIDYLAFDHQHVQDLRPYLGTATQPATYPNAKVVVQRADWDASVAPHPLQRWWWVEHSVEGADTSRLVVLDGDVIFGDGCALLFTPGHTWGNQSLLFNAPSTGCYTVSENGICADAYAPLHSKIPGLAAHAKLTGEEVVLNGNTLEGALDQYNSMVKERLCADPVAGVEGFVQHFSSSELVHSAFAPGLRATHAVEAVNEGTLAMRAQTREASGA